MCTDDGAVTVALAVATLTKADTPGISPSFCSTLAAHAAHVIPRIENSVTLSPGDDDVLPVTAADDIQSCLLPDRFACSTRPPCIGATRHWLQGWTHSLA